MSRPTPFESLHKQLGAEFKDYSGWLLPKHYGDMSAELNGLESCCGAFDLSGFGRIVVKGNGAKDLIDLFLASSTAELEQGKWVWGLCLNPDSSFLGMVRVARLNGSFMVLTSPVQRQKIVNLLQDCIKTFGIKGATVDDQTEKTGMVSVYGPKAVEILNKIIPLDLGSIDEGGVKSFSFFMMSLTVIRGGWLKYDGLELICPSGAAKFAGGAIERYHKQEQITMAGMDCLENAFADEGIKVALNEDQAFSLDEKLKAMVDMTKNFMGKDAFAC